MQLKSDFQKELSLFEKAKASKEGFARFYEYFFPIIYKYINIKTNFNRSLTEDIVQTTFIKILNKLDTIKPDKNKGIKPYLLIMAKNTLIDIYRQEKRLIPLENMENTLHVENKILDKIINQEKQEQVRNIVNNLPEKEKEIVLMKYIAGMKQKDIGNSLGMTSNNVGVTIHRVINKIRIEINQNTKGV